jgi:TRAP-type mannitol/chloroaromatic compound transport system substrate-binding protein
VKVQIPSTTIADRQQDLIRFYLSYEEMVETLCDAANYGLNTKLCDRYEVLRHSMAADYAKIRPYALAFLRMESEDAAILYPSHGASCDAFETLFRAESLQEFLQFDDGSMISRIMRTREALNLYGEHLRQLLAKANHP